MSQIVEYCPLTKLNGGLSRLHSADEDAVSWLTSYGSRHAYEKKKNLVLTGYFVWAQCYENEWTGFAVNWHNGFMGQESETVNF